MEAFAHSSFGLFLTSLFGTYFTAPSRQSLMVLAYGWSLATTQHTIASYLWLSGAVSLKHFSRFYFFLSGPFYCAIDPLWSVVIQLAARFVEADQPIEIKIDDFIKKKSGKKISAASRYRNAAGSARQEYRVLWGINFVYGIMQVPTPLGPLAVPIGLKVYLKEKVAEQLSEPFLSRSLLARQIIDLVAQMLPHRQIRVTADGGYSTKEFLRNGPQSVKNVGRFPVNSKLYELPKPVPKGRRGRKPKKGPLIGSPETLIESEGGWTPHPTEKKTRYKSLCGIWHSVLPGVVISLVVVHRTKPMPKHAKQPEIEAFFTTDLSLCAEQILSTYSQRWCIEIDIRDNNAYAGLGGDRCRTFKRIFAINTFRLLLAATRTLWFVGQVYRTESISLRRFRPWYRQKHRLSQLDVMTAYHEMLQAEGIFPTVRFLNDLTEIRTSHKPPFAEAA
jgi:hypothetical protein